MKHFIIIKDQSERVHRKNFKKLNGKPLWEHLVEGLAGEQVYIDTDSPEILEQSNKFPYVTAYARNQTHINLEYDENFVVSPVLLMIDRFLNECVSDENEIIVTPHVTSPFLSVDTIKLAAKKLEEGYDSVQACTEHKEFAYYKGQPVNFDPHVVQKTQNLEPIILGNGAFFIFTKKTFKENNNRTGNNPYFYPLSFKESIEIDTYEDFEIATRWCE